MTLDLGDLQPPAPPAPGRRFGVLSRPSSEPWVGARAEELNIELERAARRLAGDVDPWEA